MGLWRDVRHGVRLLAAARGFTALAVVTLALGIGATTAIVSLTRALFFAPLRVGAASRLVELSQTLPHRRERLSFSVSLADYRYYRDRSRTLPELAAHYPTASATGVYGLLSFAVNQRRRELAIRETLGAERRDLARLVIGRSALLAGLGVALGLIAALSGARLLTSMLYGVQPYDPLTLIAACTAIALMAIAATWLPTRRAIAIDPNTLLRER